MRRHVLDPPLGAQRRADPLLVVEHGEEGG
jgi:hypothetical protein